MSSGRRVAARYLDTGAGRGAWNMAVDEALLEACKAFLAAGGRPEEAPLTLRVYAWSPPALSLGRGQKASRDVALDLLEEAGVDLCRRLTGGRAVLHDQELTYAVIGPEALLGKTVAERYRRLSAGLAAGLERLGAPVELAPPSGRNYASQPSCFATASVCELAIGGRKVVGSAQCREGGAVLQHGSILLRSSEERLACLLRPRRGGRMAGNGALPPAGRAVGLSEALGREVSFQEVALALRAGMEEALGLACAESSLRPEEHAHAERLVAARYGNTAWTLAR